MGDMSSNEAANAAAGIDLSQFFQVFFEEAGENLESMEQKLLNLDIEAPDDEELNAIFRCAHSVKGGAATFGFSDVAELTHQMETLLDKLRRHELTPTAPMVDVLLQAGDALRAQLARHQGAGGEAIDTTELLFLIAGLVARELGTQRVARGQQHIDHHRRRRELMAAQLVQQRLHLVGQLGHIGEAEGRRAALDRVGAAEDRVQFLVVGGRDVDAQQLRFHAVEVFARFFEEDLVELAQVDAGADVRAFGCHFAHDCSRVVWCERLTG